MQEKRVSQRRDSVILFVVTLRGMGRARIRRLEVEAFLRGEEEGRAEFGEGGGGHIDEDIIDAHGLQKRARTGWTIDIL